MFFGRITATQSTYPNNYSYTMPVDKNPYEGKEIEKTGYSGETEKVAEQQPSEKRSFLESFTSAFASLKEGLAKFESEFGISFDDAQDMMHQALIEKEAEMASIFSSIGWQSDDGEIHPNIGGIVA